MRPCTPHFVLGIDNSIVLGRHYYATATIRRSCFGIVHTFVMGAGITNTSHDEDASSLWRQLMAMWYRHLILHNGFDSKDFFTSLFYGVVNFCCRRRPPCAKHGD